MKPSLLGGFNCRIIVDHVAPPAREFYGAHVLGFLRIFPKAGFLQLAYECILTHYVSFAKR